MLWVGSIALIVVLLILFKRPLFRNEICFFHPFSDGNGGGERVLWTMVATIHHRYPDTTVYIYSRPGINKHALVEIVKRQFDIEIAAERLVLVPLYTYKLLVPWYPFLTLLLQSLGSCVVALEAVLRYRPYLVIESVGFAFTYPVFRLVRARVIAYVHYPTISADMLDGVLTRSVSINNHRWIANTCVLTVLKSWYYRVFAGMYGVVGSVADLVLVNSSWTQGHINAIWNIPDKTVLLFPPADTQSLSVLPLVNRSQTILSVGQFRPEKNHMLQLDILHKLVENGRNVKLVMMGNSSVKHQHILISLRSAAVNLGVSNFLEIIENASCQEVKEQFAQSSIGLHTMSHEHFGICIIEYMAAGLIPIAHNSGGPKCDIVTNNTGFLAITAQEYADRVEQVLDMDRKGLLEMRGMARERSRAFSEEAFQDLFLDCLADYIGPHSHI